jgi:hypothetical protein
MTDVSLIVTVFPDRNYIRELMLDDKGHVEREFSQMISFEFKAQLIDPETNDGAKAWLKEFNSQEEPEFMASSCVVLYMNHVVQVYEE